MYIDMVIGIETPRLGSQPLRPLTPETTLGFEIIDFAKHMCGVELLPWQKWLVKAMYELLPDGSFRYRRVIVIVGRQNGKTTLLKILALWTMQRGPGKTVLGVAQDLSIARESWNGACTLMEDQSQLTPLLAAKNPIRKSTGDIQLTMANRSRYRIGAANGRAGRGLSVNLLILDELREMKSWSPYQAMSPTIAAQPDGMVVAISNAGEHDSVVLNGLRDTALTGAEEGVGLFEWSAPEGCELDDRDAWAQANPGLGVTVQESDLRIALGEPANLFRIERLCQRVDQIDTAIDLDAWRDCADSIGNMNALRDRVVLCLDVSPSQKHVTLAAAAPRSDGRVRVEIVATWDSPKAARAALPALLERVRPTVLGWFPGGPAAAIAADLRGIKKTVELKSTDAAPVCMGFAEQVTARQIIHGDEQILNAHVAMAQKMKAGDGWRFCRADEQDVDAVYAAAGAVHLARTAAPSVGKPRIIVAA